MIIDLMSNSVVAQKVVFSVGFNCDCCSHVSSLFKYVFFKPFVFNGLEWGDVPEISNLHARFPEQLKNT